jgi:crossover junction endodeoxyribonuclease RusA
MLIGGMARHIPSGSSANQRALRAWDNAIKAACQAQIDRSVFTAFPAETPLRVSIAFRFARPNNHYGTGGNANKLKANSPARPTGKPDVDKLARSTLDSLTGLAFYDDSRIVELTVSKGYADAFDPTVRPSFTAPGAVIQIEEWKASTATAS